MNELKCTLTHLYICKQTHTHTRSHTYQEGDGEGRADVLVLVQGTQLPWSTPLLWLCTHFRHPDLWTYISIVKLPTPGR
jgi:hypothetical protein